jgi:hypothetical protein
MSEEKRFLERLSNSSLFKAAKVAVVLLSGCNNPGATTQSGSAPQSPSAAGPTTVCTFVIPAADSPYGMQITGTIDRRFGGKLQADPIAKFNGQPFYQLGKEVYFDTANYRTSAPITPAEKITNQAIFDSVRQEAVARGCDGVAPPAALPTQVIKVQVQRVGVPTAALK